MVVLISELVLLVLIAAAVTVVDAARTPHWRGVAVERRRSWHERSAAGSAGPAERPRDDVAAPR